MLTKENQLLILCSRYQFNETEKAAFKSLLQEYIDWNILLSKLIEHRLTLIFLYHIKNEDLFSRVPRDILNFLKIKYNVNLIRYEYYKSNIDIVTETLNTHNIPYALTKGFYLMDNLYNIGSDNKNIREFGDVDLLVDHIYLDEVSTILEELGYIQGSYSFKDDTLKTASRGKKIDKILNSHEIYHFVKLFTWDNRKITTDTLNIDINFTIFEGGKSVDPINTSSLLKRRKSNNNNRGLYYLSNEDNFIHLCYHLYMDTKYKLKVDDQHDVSLMKFSDIRSMLEFKFHDFDWDYILECASTERISNAIYFSVYFLKLIYNDQYTNLILDKLPFHSSKEEIYQYECKLKNILI